MRNVWKAAVAACEAKAAKHHEAARLKRSINGEFGIAVPVPEIRRCTTVDILASIINNRLEAKANGV